MDKQLPEQKKAGEYWREYIKQFPELDLFFRNLRNDHPATELWLAQQIDIFAEKYPEAGATSSSTVKRLEDRLFALGEMDKPPCFCCGYNGEGYYQPDKHSCAERHHKLFNNL